MFDVDYKMRELINFVEEKNPIWPFGASIIDENGNTLVMATDCAHISPVYHAESLAIHQIALHFPLENYKNLSIIATSEPDPMSFSSIIWANVTGIPIRNLYWGVSQMTIKNYWEFGIDFDSFQLNQKSNPQIEITANILSKECEILFKNAKIEQDKINKTHPGKAVLSKDVSSFIYLGI